MLRVMIAVPVAASLLTFAALSQQPTEPAKIHEKAAEKAGERKMSLEELLTKALQHSPDVQVAEAKVREAEALLRQARLQVAQKLVETHSTLEKEQHLLGAAEKEYRRAVELNGKSVIPASDVERYQVNLQAIKIQLAQHEAQLNALVGNMPAGIPKGNFTNYIGLVGIAPAAAGAASDESKPRMPKPEQAAKLRKALDQQLKRFDKAMMGIPLQEVIEFVRDSTGAQILANIQDRAGDAIRINFKGDVTLGGFFQILLDTVPDLHIYVRDYGFLVTFDTVPDGMTIANFSDAVRPEKGGSIRN